MPFKEIKPRKTKAMYVAQQILDTIRQGEYPVGSRLPPERLIAEQMNVSRNSVREALSALQIIGLIESRVGDGTRIRSVGDRVGLSHVLTTILKESQDLFEVWEGRKEIESSLIKLAIDRITPESLDQIRHVLDTMRRTIHTGDSVAYLRANTAFHLAIAEAAYNVPLKNALCALMEITTQQLSEDVNLGYVLKSINKSFQKHEDIYNAIKTQNTRAATAAVEKHFEELKEYFGSKYWQEKGSIHKGGGA